MTKLTISKSSLKHQRDQLRLFQRFLPSLDLKRQQLLTELKRAQQELLEAQASVESLDAELEPMLFALGGSRMDLSGLVTVETVEVVEENIVGARLPRARQVSFQRAEYSTLARPFWVDYLVEDVQRMATLRVQLQVHQERVTRLKLAVRRITQRVNLFEKVLIPGARDKMKRIQLGLSEQERSAVVRSKIAKRKHERQAGSGGAP